jgi:hypothetical protein
MGRRVVGARGRAFGLRRTLVPRVLQNAAPDLTRLAWLNDPATFTEGQVWPYRVEFVDGGFEPGVLNVHHGPLILFAGAIGEVRSPEDGDGVGFRDLRYFYGSYAISPRLARPTRLRFRAEELDGATLVTVRLDSFVRGGFVGPWDYAQRIFWSRFPGWMDSSL